MNKIPKIIHYCWFGPNKKPKSVLNYIEGWKQLLPDYQIIEWNESNFDVNCCEYVTQAYEAKKFAFVSDYARLKALYEYGGIYFDTDVQVLKSFDTFLDTIKADVIFGYEEKQWVCTSTMMAVKASKLIEKFTNQYHDLQFYKSDGSIDTSTNVYKLTRLLETYGLNRRETSQELTVAGEVVQVLKQEYLSPLDYIRRVDNKTENSICMHMYDVSWGKRSQFLVKLVKQTVSAILGKKMTVMFYKYVLGQ